MTLTTQTAALDSLPIFPLPDVVLLPGAVLPLNVFEPRYRDMTRDALAGERLLGMARLLPGYQQDYAGRPPVHDIVGLGRIVTTNETDDGRYHLLLRGIARVRIVEELPPDHSYRRVRAEILDSERSTRPQTLTSGGEQLIAMSDRLADAVDGASGLRNIVREAETPGACADLISAALLADPEERQRLLEMLDPADRVDRVIELLARATAELGGESDLLN